MGTDGLSGSSVITINRLFNKLLRAIDGSASIGPYFKEKFNMK